MPRTVAWPFPAFLAAAAIAAAGAFLPAAPARAADLARAEERKRRLLADIYARLTPWQKTMVARHPDRPRFSAYVAGLVTDFTPLAGDLDQPATLGRLAGLATRVVHLAPPAEVPGLWWRDLRTSALIRALARRPFPADVRVTFATREAEAIYSGMLPGVLAGRLARVAASWVTARR